LVLAADGKLDPRDVKTGITNSVDIQILEGLNVGDNVVLSLPGKKEPEERIMM
ncbi:efflux transporter periplasmic adaptor subunit, partial [Salmonella enterica subsp. enterica serovar Cerro]